MSATGWQHCILQPSKMALTSSLNVSDELAATGALRF